MTGRRTLRGAMGVVAAFPPRPRELRERLRSAEARSLGVWVIVAVGAALRWYYIDAEGLWLDEIASYQFATQRYDSALELVTTVPTVDPHPPLYYLLLRWWTDLFGTTEVALRSMSMLLGVGTVLLTYLLAVKLFDRRSVGWLASALVAVSCMHIYFAQEARMYTLLTLLTVASFYWYLDLVFADDVSPASVSRYVVATVLLGYTHTFAVFLFLAQNVFVLILARRDIVRDNGRLRWIPRLRESGLFRRWAGVQLVVILLLAPWLALLTAHAFGLPFVAHSTTDWIPIEAPWYPLRTFHEYLFYNIREFPIPGQAWTVWVALGLAIAALLRFNSDAGPADDTDEIEVGHSDRSLLLAVWLVVGIAVPFAVSSLFEPIYRHKYTIGASIAFFLMIARGVDKLDAEYSRWFAYGLAVVVVLATVTPITGIYDERQKPDWRGGIAELESDADGDPLVLTSPEFVTGPIEYYAERDGTTVVGVPKTASWNGTLSAAVGNHSVVWIVFSDWYIERSQGRYLLEEFEAGGYHVDVEAELELERIGNSKRAVQKWGVFAFELRRYGT